MTAEAASVNKNRPGPAGWRLPGNHSPALEVLYRPVHPSGGIAGKKTGGRGRISMLVERGLLPVIAALMLLVDLGGTGAARAADAALTGQVTSAEEGAMEGVLVTAQKDGSNIRVTVVSDDKGRYSFPAAKLDAGHYSLRIRAAGYDLDSPKAADVAAGAATTADIKLVKTKNLSAQLNNSEWMKSVPQ